MSHWLTSRPFLMAILSDLLSLYLMTSLICTNVVSTEITCELYHLCRVFIQFSWWKCRICEKHKPQVKVPTTKTTTTYTNSVWHLAKLLLKLLKHLEQRRVVLLRGGRNHNNDDNDDDNEHNNDNGRGKSKLFIAPIH